MPIQRILLTPGEPAGIGPDITLSIAQRDWPVEMIAVADPALLAQRAEQLGVNVQLQTYDNTQKNTAHVAGSLKVLPVQLKAPAIPGKLNHHNAAYVLETLKIAAQHCQAQADTTALVTGPVHKGILNEAGFAFSGHTEFLAACSHTPKTVMLFVVDQLRVALATTHLPLKSVAGVITPDLLSQVITLLHAELQRKFQLAHPKIFVCGLNPHAGEGGHLGDEEIKTIIPTLMALRAQGIDIIGPLPADTIFTPKYLKQADVVLAMYHDQALPFVKYVGFGNAVNVTLGLPYIRTSVDHGTALDIAGSGQADASSLAAAIQLAINMM